MRTITGDYNYNNNVYHGHAFGKLYTWAAIMNGASSSNSNPSGVQGVCPVGWHLPSAEEWKILEFTSGKSLDEYNTIGEPRGNQFEGSRLKATPEVHMWQHLADSAGNNQTGFSALPGGVRTYTGVFTGIYVSAFFWTCTEFDVPTPIIVNYSILSLRSKGIMTQRTLPFPSAA